MRDGKGVSLDDRGGMEGLGEEEGETVVRIIGMRCQLWVLLVCFM